jgi:hypothetical protein
MAQKLGVIQTFQKIWFWKDQPFYKLEILKKKDKK